VKEKIILVLKGFIMGIANIIPGVSGGTLALILGIYEKFIGAISHLFSNFKENAKFLLLVFIGIGLSLITMSNVITYSYENFPIPTTMFFMGLVVGGIPLLYKKVKGKKEKKQISSWIIFALTFALVIFMAVADKIFGASMAVDFTHMNIGSYVLLFLVGAIAAATMIIPGVSGSLVLMLLGYYYPIINLIKELTQFNNIFGNLVIAGVFGVGILVGIVLISKLIEFLFKKFEIKTYYGVLGFIFASIIAIPIATFSEVQITFNVLHIIIGIIVAGIGGVIAYKLGEK